MVTGEMVQNADAMDHLDRFFPAGVLFSSGSDGSSFINGGTGVVNSLNDAAVHVVANSVTITNAGMLGSGSGTAVILMGNDNVLNQRAGLISGNIVMGGGANEVMATGGTIMGAMLTQSGTSAVSLTNTTWNMTASSNVTNLMVNGGSNITFPAVPPGIMDPSLYHMLTANTFTGSPNSEIVMNAFLGGQGSPSDKIVITGGPNNALNQSLAFVNTNLSGAGVGPPILVVQSAQPTGDLCSTTMCGPALPLTGWSKSAMTGSWHRISSTAGATTA